ncbi:hypothetical protein [uncultured Brevundimonas sp.]|uniref:hypothetical protein n=1 Tax=uncultured Brevundimonas sp. TaxID=213418 RepID=UPI00261E1568|nr:hypothetical protein [uncultured Brevundimonas sp.]
MATILFEIWETDDSMECVPVSAQADAMREPDARFVKAFYASTPNEAGQVYYDHYDWGTYKPVEGVTDIPFSEEERAFQSEYLTRRVLPDAHAARLK